MPGKHAAGTKLFAAHCPPLLARKLDWLLESYRAKVPVDISAASMVKMLLEEAADRHIPKEVLLRLTKEQEKADGEQTQGGGKTRQRLG